MVQRVFCLVLLGLLLTGCRASQVEELIDDLNVILSLSMVELEPTDRVLVLAPHPDDETLGASGVIQEAVAMDLPVYVAWLTYGDFNEWSFILYRRRPNLSPREVRQMGELRREEALAAAQLLGVPEENLFFLGYPDFGTLDIWYRHWGEGRAPLRSRLTRATEVPYRTAFRPEAAYKGEEILADIKAILRQVHPTKIFTTGPADYQPDHRALYLFLQIALWDLADELDAAVYTYLIHYPGWPQPWGYYPQATLAPPPGLLGAYWQDFPLEMEQIARKFEALQVHATQFRSGGRKLRSFIRQNELFGQFPTVLLREGREVVQNEDAGESAIPDYLTDEEEEVFVEVEESVVRLQDDQLIVIVHFSRRLPQEVQAQIYAFGYRSDVSFVEMPKLRVMLGPLRYAVYDQNRRLPNDSITVFRRPREVEIHIPLALLDEPHRLLVGARTMLGEVPLDWLAWRTFILPPVE